MNFKEYLSEKPVEGDKEEYTKFFNKMLKKYGVESPEELSKEERKKFFDEVDAGWEADNETDMDENTEEAELDSIASRVDEAIWNDLDPKLQKAIDQMDKDINAVYKLVPKALHKDLKKWQNEFDSYVVDKL